MDEEHARLTGTVNQKSKTTGTGSIIDVGVPTDFGGHDLSNPGGRVEEVGEPSHESANLHVADPTNRLWQMDDGLVDGMEDIGEFASEKKLSVIL